MATPNWQGIGADVLRNFLKNESGEGASEGNFGLDIFINGFEDEFPSDADDPVGGNYVAYSIEAERAAETRPWGGKFGDRPKIHELNQPPAAQALGWRVIDFYPNRDNKAEFYRLAGTPSELRVMLQVVQANRIAGGRQILFSEWFEQWENGFPDFTENRSDSNFLLTGEKQWPRIKDPKTRPRYREFTSSVQRSDSGYRVIDSWRDRSAESSSVILSGTDLQLIQHIIQLEYEGGGSNNGKTKNGNWPLLKGQPQIKLYFLATNGKGEAEISLRIMDKSDDPKSPLPKIDKSDLKKYAAAIKQQFATPSLFLWQKGRDVISYRNRWQGFEGWYLCRNEIDGRALVTKLLAVTGENLDENSIRFTTAPAAAFPTAPADITVLGKLVSQDTERPLVDVAFHRAEISLTKLKRPIPLVERGRIIYD